MGTEKNRYQARVQSNTLKVFCWTAAWVLAVALLTFGPRFLWDETRTLTWAAFAVTVLVGIGMVIANKHHLRDLDELHSKVMLDAMAITLSVPLVIGIPYSVLNAEELVPAGDTWASTFAGLLVVMSLTFLISIVIGMRRYR